MSAVTTGQVPLQEPHSSGGIRAFVFIAMLLFVWIGTSPYVDLTAPDSLALSSERSSRINQIISILIFFGLLSYGLMHPLRSIILNPKILYAAIFIWFIFVTLLSDFPILGIKALILAFMTSMNAAAFLLLPSSERHFAKMLAAVTGLTLVLAYGGVMFLPHYSIHQAAELREPMNAGYWRGHFQHKNLAAAAMVMSAFIGLFVMSVWSRWIGVVILVLSALFLTQTGGKTATAMLPTILILSWLFERFRFLRIPIVIGGILLFNIVAVGSAVSLPLREFVVSLGVDPTFTNRSGIWQLAFTAISERPLTGYGMNGFWQTPQLVHGGGAVESWAVAAFNGHNGYLDMWLQTGLPGLLLTLVLMVFLPLHDLNRIDASGTHDNVTRLFTRIWLYSLYNACLESVFFSNGSVWFMLMVAINSFRLRASAIVVTAPAPARTAHG